MIDRRYFTSHYNWYIERRHFTLHNIWYIIWYTLLTGVILHHTIFHILTGVILHHIWFDILFDILIGVNLHHTICDISFDILIGYYKCSLHPSNQLRLELFVYDVNAHATRLNAIDAEEVEITSCVISGSGNIVSPFYVTSKINMNDDSEMINSCGMTKVYVIFCWEQSWTNILSYFHTYVSFDYKFLYTCRMETYFLWLCNIKVILLVG
jgi:hypothetical protein